MQSQPDIIPRASDGNPLFSAFGIDLGTTNSAIAALAWNPLQRSTVLAECLAIQQTLPDGKFVSSTNIPSVVAIKQSDVLIGEGAKWLKARNGYQPWRNLFFECKNDIGVRRTYHEAPAGFRTAREISATILEFLMKQASGLPPPWSQQVVVTVPASFSAAQRRETISAAQAAGISCREGMLLDEPVAAFIDYIITNADRLDLAPGQEKRLLVFDFGGGTSDVAIFTITDQGEDNPIQIAPLAVSRYYQIGGGDIDRAIVHKVLIPQLVEQNGLARYTLGFQEKKRLEAPLSELAEFLKIRLCNAVMATRARGGSKEEVAELSVAIVGEFTYRTGNQELHFHDPVLNMADFAEALKPFLDLDLLYPKEDEYIKTNSIFAPLMNTLKQCRLDFDDIDYLLMVGGSSLIPQVVDLFVEIFSESKILTYKNPVEMIGAVARGAAYQALSLLHHGKGIMETVCHDRILVRTEGSGVELIPRGASLPYPAEGFAACRTLALPETSITGTPVRVEIEGGSGKLLFSSIWEIEQPVRRGEPLLLEYRMDGDQVLHLRLAGATQELPEFGCLIEHPITVVHNSNDRKNKILELEENLRLEVFSPEEEAVKILELAQHCTALGQNEKALGLMSSALSKKGPDLNILNYMGICCKNLGDDERAEKLYREAASVAPRSSTPLFNLALMQFRQGQYEQGLSTLDEAIARNPEPAYYVLRAEMLEKLARAPAEKAEALETAISGLAGSLPQLSSWELFWLGKGADMRGDSELLSRLDVEQTRRDAGEVENSQGKLPIVCQDLVLFGKDDGSSREIRSATVLLVEDEPILLVSLVEMLPDFELQEHCFLTAPNGEAALEIIRAGGVDLVCTNLNMPRLDGFELMEHLRNEFPNIPYMAFSGFGVPDMAKKVMKQGAYAFLEKPFDIEVFAEKVKYGLLQIGPKRKDILTLAEYLGARPPADDEYWHDVIYDMGIAMDLRDGCFGNLTEGDPEKCIAYHLMGTDWGEEVWAKLRIERPELFNKPGLPPSSRKAQ